MSDLANNTTTMRDILALINSLPEGGGGGVSPNGTAWTPCEAASDISQNYFEQVLNANGIWVACSSTSGVWYSEDGKYWTLSNLGSSAGCTCVCYGKGVWVVGGVRTYYSTDGKTWTACALASGISIVPPVHRANSVFYGGGRFVAFMGGTSPTGGGAWYSDDGKTWSRGNLTSSTQAGIAMWCEGLWVAVFGAGLSNKGIWYSTDGINWTISNFDDGGSSFRSVLSYADGLWVYASEPGYGLRYSTDGATWTPSNITEGTFYFVGKLNGLWIAGGAEGYGMYYSSDGKTWTQSHFTGGVNFGCAENGVCVATGADALYYSTDGMTWQQCDNDTMYCYIVFYAHGMWVASGVGLYYSVGWEPS